MKQFIIIAVLFAMGGGLLAAADDDARDCKCARCGCEAHCHRVCRVVCEMKDVKKVCYCCKEEDACIPGRSKKTGEECVPDPCCQAHPADCEACAEGRHSFLDRLFNCHRSCEVHRTLWEPGCSGRTREVNKLLKFEVRQKLPTYKWVVEYCCDRCCAEAGPDQLQPAAENIVGSDAQAGETKADKYFSPANGNLRNALRKLSEPTFLKRLESEPPPERSSSAMPSPAAAWNGYSAR